MVASKLSLRILVLLSTTTLACVAGCAIEPPADGDGENGETTEAALSANGGRTMLYYLGSSSFLRQCAGNTLGCGRAVSSVSDSTPYFSAPRTWSRSTCDDYYTFEANGRCVEAQRLEVSDTRNFIEGNPGLFRGLGLRSSDGRNCAGSGQATVTMKPGRHCGSSSSAPPAPAPSSTTSAPADPAPAADDPGDGACFSATLNKGMPAMACVQSRSNSIWYQCHDRKWYRGVSDGDGPFGACASLHPLP